MTVGSPSSHGQCRIQCRQAVHRLGREFDFGLADSRIRFPPVPQNPTLESPILVLDAASPVVTVGLVSRADGSGGDWRTSRDEAGVALFGLTEQVLRRADLRLAEVRTLIFCEGPGSLLGIRLAAMAIRTWLAVAGPAQAAAVFGYRSLALAAASLLADGTPPPFHVLSDARRQSWNLLSVSTDGTLGEIARWPAANPLPAGSICKPEGFPNWQPLPPETTTASYDPRRLLELAERFPLLQRVSAPDAFLIATPSYREWSATPASAATAASSE